MPWSVLGQSYGGFCTVTYLSLAPEGMREAFITGGLPGLYASAEDVYRETYPIVAQKNVKHYERYPQDLDAVRRVAEHLRGREVRLPGGGTLTLEPFQALGRGLGQSTGSHRLHYLLEEAFVVGPAGPELSDTFLHGAEAELSLAPSPLYAVLHEACYAAGTATRWAAQRVRAEFPQFSGEAALHTGAPVLFTGEMIYPWLFDLDPALRPLRDAAELLAEREDWPPLYDADRLRANRVPVAAAVYHDDMYVPRTLSLETAATIRGLRAWVTSEYDHDGLRVSDGRVLDRLIGMVRGTV